MPETLQTLCIYIMDSYLNFMIDYYKGLFSYFKIWIL